MQQTGAILGFGLKEDGKVAFPAHFHYSVVRVCRPHQQPGSEAGFQEEALGQDFVLRLQLEPCQRPQLRMKLPVPRRSPPLYPLSGCRIHCSCSPSALQQTKLCTEQHGINDAALQPTVHRTPLRQTQWKVSQCYEQPHACKPKEYVGATCNTDIIRDAPACASC